MADETATISDNTTEPTEQATTPTPAPTLHPRETHALRRPHSPRKRSSARPAASHPAIRTPR